MKARALMTASMLVLPWGSHAMADPETKTPGEAADQLFTHVLSGEGHFRTALAEAEKAGVGKQVLIEAEIFHRLARNNVEALPTLLPDLELLLEEWNFEESELFRTRAQLLSMRAAIRAQQARSREEMDTFEIEVKESFWQDPEFSRSIGVDRWVAEYHQADRMSKITVPMNLEIAVSRGGMTTLGNLVKDWKAILLDFWATWCGPCIQLMPETLKRAETLKSKGILVAGMNTESVEKAEAFRRERKISHTWLIEPSDRPLSRLLLIDSIPRMVLVGREGQVLFNGHPMDGKLEIALAQLEAD